MMEVYFVKSEAMPQADYQKLLLGLIEQHGMVFVPCTNVRVETMQLLEENDILVIGPVRHENQRAFAFGTLDALDSLMHASENQKRPPCIFWTLATDAEWPTPLEQPFHGPITREHWMMYIVE